MYLGIGIAAIVVIVAAVMLRSLSHRASGQDIHDIIYHPDTSPEASAAARATLIEKIKTNRDPQWLKFGCLQYSQENDLLERAARARGTPFTPPPTCRDLNPLAPADGPMAPR